MPLSPSRLTRVGETPYPHEEEGIAFVRDALPDSEPYRAWALFELPDPSTGRLLEVDMLVLGYGALYLLELKAHPGRMSGDATDWWWQPPDGGGRKVWVEPPYRLANLKAKILKSRLRQFVRNPDDLPYIQALVFLSSDELQNDLRADGRIGVVTRNELRDALLRNYFPGASSRPNRRVSKPQIEALTRALDKLGIRARKGKVLAGEYELRELTGEGPGYQDRRAVHRANEKLVARARTYLVPEQTSVERRQQLRRAADRESALLYDVREHPNVLSWAGYVPDAPLGPTVLLDAFEGGQPLPAFLRSQTVTFEDQLAILEQAARALAYCHRREVFHGGLSPDAVLVRRPLDGSAGVEVRLASFQLGRGQDVDATSHASALATSPTLLYQAPEAREGAPASACADMFSLGAVAYYLFTQRPPAEDLVDLYQKLADHQALDPRVVDKHVSSAVAEAIEFATAAVPSNRIDDADEWLAFLFERLTAPAPEESPTELDPLTARPTDIVGGDLLVDRVLGQGATARVLQVTRESDGRDLALKVSLEPEHDDRLRAEAEVLGRLRHPRIVPLHDVRTIAGRTCLLLGLAGSATLRRHLDEEGTVSLDFASRYGDDLLSALEHLEDPDVQVTHRDIKPANLGVGTAGKTAHHLTLFDFSLSHSPRTEVAVGTSAYRDPFLVSRGAWDAAADRWSAAVTLHEMLTGARPGYAAALDPHAPLTLSAERFDAAVRDRLVAFFERALHRDVERRFASAADMRRAWYDALEAPAVVEPTPTGPVTTPPPPDEELTDDEVRAIGPDTPVMALPLSFRARNGLDRAGLLVARDLLALPENRISAVRGVGAKVARAILAFRERWASLAGVEASAGPVLAPGWSGDDALVTAAGLDAPLARALADAGLATLAAVARAPRDHVEALASRAEVKVDAVLAALERHAARPDAAGPRTVEALVDELFPKKSKRAGHVRALFGLAPPFEGRLDVTAREVAKHTGKTTATVYLAVGALREAWLEHEALGELEDLASAILDRAGGAVPLSRAADTVLGKVAHDPTAPRALSRARAAALLRVVAEVQKEDLDGVRAPRLGGGEPWLLASQDYVQGLRKLGQAADALARRDVLVTPGEAQRELERVARGSPLEAAPPAQLTEWAAAASETAACSALLEIYPRGLPPERAVELCSTLLTAAARGGRRGDGLTVDEVAQKVAARYPAAAPLPKPPALDELLAKVPLTWDDEAKRYRRPGDGAGNTALGTSYGSRVVVSRHPAPDVDVDLDLERFERALKVAVEQRAFRAVAVNPAYAFEAAEALAAKLGVPARPLDDLLLDAMRGVMRDKRIAPEVVHAADREGRGGKAWARLVSLMRMAEQRVLADLRGANTEPLLLTNPGLLARYGLTDLTEGLLARVAEDDAEAIFLLVPCHDYGGVPRIQDRHPMPGVLSVHALRVPRAFVPLDESEAA
ncbi:MAG: protein kinase [Sandaracinaceae bacterium]|nr:protein kinase [Sandaracinaceae bacterium]